jgi:pyruvate kinase
VHASLIVVLTRGGSTARLVAKYRPLVPVLTVAVPVLTTDSLTWTCSGEAPARQVRRGGRHALPCPALLAAGRHALRCGWSLPQVLTSPPPSLHSQCLITRGLIPLLAEGSARATDTDTTDEILAAAIEHAKRMRWAQALLRVAAAAGAAEGAGWPGLGIPCR